MSEVREFDAICERLSAQVTSFTEREALGELWTLGEDGWLREDDRSRRTPSGRWILLRSLLAGAKGAIRFGGWGITTSSRYDACSSSTLNVT